MENMSEFPKAKSVSKSRFSFVWLTPILALAITGWLLYNGYINNGKEIKVQFDSGAGIVAGKTPLQYRGINIGKVKGFEVADSLDKVNVVIKLDKQASSLAREGMVFWVVKPRVGIDRITGLETIVSGTYIEVRPPTYDLKQLEELKEQDTFIGLKDPPSFNNEEGYINVELVADETVIVSAGMAVYHKGVEAGKVLNVEYDEEINKKRISLVVGADFNKYINSSTKFWNISGIDLKLDAAGISLDSISLLSAIQGGIAFESDFNSETPEPLNKYILYDNYEDTKLGDQTSILYLPESYGIKAYRTPVMFKGIKIGQVTSVGFSDDKQMVMSEIRLIKQYESFLKKESKFILHKPELSFPELNNIDTIISGVYIELLPGEGEAQSEFTLYQEPVSLIPEGSQIIKITSDDRRGVRINSGLYFKGVKIGHVTGLKLEGEKVVFDGAIYSDFTHLLNKRLYFWQPDLLTVEQNAKGLIVDTDGLTQLLDSGISLGYFSSSPDERKIKTYTLYKDENSAKEEYISNENIQKIYLYAMDASGLKKGSPLIYRGLQVGEIGNSYLLKDGSIRVTAMIYSQYRYLMKGNTYFWKQEQVTFKFDGQGFSADVAPLENVIHRGILFDNDASENFVDNRVLFESKSEADKALKLADAGAVIRLTIKGVDLPLAGADVHYRGVKTGEISKTGYDPKSDTSYAEITISKQFKDTVTERSRFWRNGSVEVNTTGDGFKIKTEPLSGYVTGSVSYDNFKKQNGTKTLYDSRKTAAEQDYTEVEVSLDNPEGLRTMAPVMLRGVEAGYVKSLENTDTKTIAKVLIYDRYQDSLREGAMFWVEGVQASLEGIDNAESVVFGPKLMMLSGTGEKQYRFTAHKGKVSPFYNKEGLRVVVISPSRNSLEVGSPVYYRQIETGGVEWIRLSDDGANVEIGLFIDNKYKHLVRVSTVFSSVSGIDLGFGLFSGLKVKTESVKSIIRGGISFMTSDMSKKKAIEGSKFELE